MTPKMRKQIKQACARALKNPSSIFVDAPGTRPAGSCESCGEMRPIVEHTGCCDECSEELYQMYPESRP